MLRSLTKAPYEPLAQAPLKFLTHKAAFLLAFASAARRSEIHAWDSSSLKHEEDWSKVYLTPVPGFLAKNQSPSDPPRVMSISALSTILAPDMVEDRALCPVRALKRYLATVRAQRGGRKRLFLSYKPGFTKEIGPNTVSAWLKQVIRFAYEYSDEEDLRLFSVSAHEVRALATSWAAFQGSSIASILEAAFWKANTTFTSHYLRDLSVVADQLHALGPLSAAQRRV